MNTFWNADGGLFARFQHRRRGIDRDLGPIYVGDDYVDLAAGGFSAGPRVKLACQLRNEFQVTSALFDSVQGQASVFGRLRISENRQGALIELAHLHEHGFGVRLISLFRGLAPQALGDVLVHMPTQCRYGYAVRGSDGAVGDPRQQVRADSLGRGMGAHPAVVHGFSVRYVAEQRQRFCFALFHSIGGLNRASMRVRETGRAENKRAVTSGTSVTP